MPHSMSHTLTRVDCHYVKTNIRPEPDVMEQHQDYFGNSVYTFAIEAVHQELDVTVQSEVTVHHDEWPAGKRSVPWSEIVKGVPSGADVRWYEVQEFCFDSPRVSRHQRYADYALLSFTDDRDAFAATLDLTERLNRDFKYDTTATDVNTPTDTAFDIKAGVCQDFSHVQIACLRSIGLPARYVSGYLRTIPREGAERLVGADESHAWVSVYLGSELGWVDVDPTNACRCDTNHIPICVGRDYSEVSPMRGVVLGGGKTQLSVKVDVELVSEG